MSNQLTSCSCKIGRAIDSYQLTDLNDEIKRRRSADNASLRDLTDFVNRRILEAAIGAAPDTAPESDLFGAFGAEDAVVTMYETLTNDDVTSDRKARIRIRLERAGVDVDTVESDWITHPTIRKHLQTCLNIDTGSSPAIDGESAGNTIEWARTRCVGIVENTIDRLRSADRLSITSVDVTVSIQVTCTECQKTYRPTQLVSRGACACVSETMEEEAGDSNS